MKVRRVKNVDGTSLVGYVTTTFDRLVQVFGRPCIEEPGELDKVNILWKLEIQKKTITIYDYKEKVPPTVGEYRWHIGGYVNGVDRIVGEMINS